MVDQTLLLSDKAGAALLSVSRATWWRRVEDGTLPAPIKLGKLTRWRRDEVLDAVARATALRDDEAHRLAVALKRGDRR